MKWPRMRLSSVLLFCAEQGSRAKCFDQHQRPASPRCPVEVGGERAEGGARRGQLRQAWEVLRPWGERAPETGPWHGSGATHEAHGCHQPAQRQPGRACAGPGPTGLLRVSQEQARLDQRHSVATGAQRTQVVARKVDCHTAPEDRARGRGLLRPQNLPGLGPWLGSSVG